MLLRQVGQVPYRFVMEHAVAEAADAVQALGNLFSRALPPGCMGENIGKEPRPENSLVLALE